MFRRPRLDLAPATVAEVIDSNVALAARLDVQERARLVDFTIELARSKRWELLDGLVITPEIVVTIAANAAIPVLALDLGLYRHVSSIIVRPAATVSHGIRAGRIAGAYSSDAMTIIGEATPNTGPIALSWDAARHDSRHPHGGTNVVVHEFAHKIDGIDGYGDGTPPLRGQDLAAWMAVFDDEFERADARESDEVLREYAWTNRAEFFAVATETFFCRPRPLQDAKPALYAALAGFFRQDPAANQPD